MLENQDIIEKITQRLILAMAYNREVYIDKIQFNLNCAIDHFYRATLAKKMVRLSG
jgi:nitric oxide synthase oxygenase domain/subunit